MKNFEPNIDPLQAFCIRGDLLRPKFGDWDANDPVSHAILDLVEAQSELTDAINDEAEYGIGDAVIRAARDKLRRRREIGALPDRNRDMVQAREPLKRTRRRCERRRAPK